MGIVIAMESLQNFLMFALIDGMVLIVKSALQKQSKKRMANLRCLRLR